MINLVDTFSRCREVTTYIHSPKGAELLQQTYAQINQSSFLQQWFSPGSIEQIMNNLYCNGSYPTVAVMVEQLIKSGGN